MDERDERKRTSDDASKRFRRHQNWGCTTAPGRVWRKPTYWPRGVRCIGGMTLVRALVRNLRTCPAMPREKAQARPHGHALIADEMQRLAARFAKFARSKAAAFEHLTEIVEHR